MDRKRQKMTLWNKFKDKGKGKVAPQKPTYVSRDNMKTSYKFSMLKWDGFS